jgi:DNA-binding transcriptional LysR family regulator
MNFYQLVYFRKVAETKSVSRAAEELFITQPAVSKQVRALEEELGEKLFDRIGKKVFLTKTGQVLWVHADKILRLLEEAKTAVRDLSEECSGEFVIGTSDHISLHRLPGILKRYITAFCSGFMRAIMTEFSPPTISSAVVLSTSWRKTWNAPSRLEMKSTERLSAVQPYGRSLRSSKVNRR